MKELKDEISRLHAENATLQAGYDAARLEIDHLRGATQSKLLAQPVAWMVYLPSIDTQHIYYSQEDMGYVDDVTNHADAEVTPLYEMAPPKAEVAPAAAAGQCEDAIELLGKYKELCEEIKRGDSYHIGRIDAAISVLAQAAPQPAVQQGDADVEGAIKSAFFRSFGAGAERDWHTEPGGWFIEGYRAAHPAAPVAQGDAEDAARYRWIAAHCRSTSEHWGGRWSIVVEGPAPKSHDSEDDFDAAIDAARSQAKEGALHVRLL